MQTHPSQAPRTPQPLRNPLAAAAAAAAPAQVLTYGIATAAVLRLVMIVLGVDIVERFEPVLLLFAGILIYSSYKMLAGGEDDEDEDLENNKIVKFCR